MPLADPDAAAAYNRERWRTHGATYRANRTPEPPPLSRGQVLHEDVRQALELERLEVARLGRRRARERFAAWLRAEREWIGRTATVFVIGGLDGQQSR